MRLDYLVNILENIVWLSRVGEADSLEIECKMVSDTNDAIENAISDKWKDTLYDIKLEIIKHSSEYYERRIGFDSEFRYIEKEYVDKFKDNLLVIDYEFYSSVRDTIEIICLYYYFEPKMDSYVIESMLSVFMAGHVPCGWDGYYPSGKIRVY